MTVRTLDRLIGAGLFVFALILYTLTVAPTASFWDPGERITAAHGLQIPHPPGAPLYMLIGRLFSMFIPTDYVALAVNMVSVVASALTIMLTFLIIVRLVREWKGPRETWDQADMLVACGGGVIGALALAVSSSFWFNAVEAETYALSTSFTALCVWLTLKWVEHARIQDASLAAGKHHTFGSGAERWLVVIAYVYGLAIGVHLLSLLSIFFAALIIYFQHFERPEWTPGRQLLGLVAAAGVSIGVFLLIYPGLIQILPTVARRSGAPLFFLIAVVAVLVLGIRYTQKRRLHVPNLLLLCVTTVLIGYSSYAVIIIRSAANPPMDQNDPEDVDSFISYMQREQYGATPLLRGPAFDDRLGRVHPRDETLFPRRWSSMPEHERVYAQYSSDLDFFWSYQINYMYLRYFMWQWAGRESDRQGAQWTSGIFQRAAIEDPDRRTPSERYSRNVYYALPLLLGLFGLGFHAARDWRRALAVGVLFFMTGLGIVLYLNQTPLQPRERDYSYAGSFFAFSLWIGIGAAGMIELITDSLRRQGQEVRQQLFAGGAVGAILLLAVPGVMIYQNYSSHDRTGRYVAPDFAWNMLHSVDENAILFTNGDNDTFPLWYLQEVEGVRRDVRVVNLSLLQTPWYIRQLMTQQARDSAPIPMTFTEDEIERIRPTLWEPRTMALPVDVSPEVRRAWGDPEDLPDTFTWTVEGRRWGPEANVLFVNDLVILSILEATAAEGWERPIYFATTTGLDGQVSLAPFLQIEGLALRVTPVRSPGRAERVVPEIALANLERFRFRELDNPRVYFDENKRSMIDNYRSAVFAPIARQLARIGRQEDAERVMQQIREAIPFDIVRPGFVSLYMMAEAYNAIGDSEQVVALMREAEPMAIERLERARTGPEMDMAAQFVQTVQSFYLENRAFEEAAAFSESIAIVLGDPRYRQTPEQLRQMVDPDEVDRLDLTTPGVEAPPARTDPVLPEP